MLHPAPEEPHRHGVAGEGEGPDPGEERDHVRHGGERFAGVAGELRIGEELQGKPVGAGLLQLHVVTQVEGHEVGGGGLLQAPHVSCPVPDRGLRDQGAGPRGDQAGGSVHGQGEGGLVPGNVVARKPVPGIGGLGEGVGSAVGEHQSSGRGADALAFGVGTRIGDPDLDPPSGGDRGDGTDPKEGGGLEVGDLDKGGVAAPPHLHPGHPHTVEVQVEPGQRTEGGEGHRGLGADGAHGPVDLLDMDVVVEHVHAVGPGGWTELRRIARSDGRREHPDDSGQLPGVEPQQVVEFDGGDETLLQEGDQCWQRPRPRRRRAPGRRRRAESPGRGDGRDEEPDQEETSRQTVVEKGATQHAPRRGYGGDPETSPDRMSLSSEVPARHPNSTGFGFP